MSNDHELFCVSDAYFYGYTFLPILTIIIRLIGMTSRSRQHLLSDANRICQRFFFASIPFFGGAALNPCGEGFSSSSASRRSISSYIPACLGLFVPLTLLFLESLSRVVFSFISSVKQGITIAIALLEDHTRRVEENLLKFGID
jgi:hypothetical protein